MAWKIIQDFQLNRVETIEVDDLFLIPADNKVYI